MIVERSISEPIREHLSQREAWHAEDNGLIAAWEYGRRTALTSPAIAAAAGRGELPILVWKGGIAKSIKRVDKCGPLWYYAAWQGLRGESLRIDSTQRTSLTCTRFAVTVSFSPHLADYGGDE